MFILLRKLIHVAAICRLSLEEEKQIMPQNFHNRHVYLDAMIQAQLHDDTVRFTGLTSPLTLDFTNRVVQLAGHQSYIHLSLNDEFETADDTLLRMQQGFRIGVSYRREMMIHKPPTLPSVAPTVLVSM